MDEGGNPFGSGTVLDPFGYQTERRQERALIDQFTADLRSVLTALTHDNLPTAVALAELPDQIRGFGPVKDSTRLPCGGLICGGKSGSTLAG